MPPTQSTICDHRVSTGEVAVEMEFVATLKRCLSDDSMSTPEITVFTILSAFTLDFLFVFRFIALKVLPTRDV